MKINHLPFYFIILSFFLFTGCQRDVKGLSLEDKIARAVESRKMPSVEDQTIKLTKPESIIERGPHITELVCHMEDYYPTVLIEKGNTKTRMLYKNISPTLGQEILTSPYFKKKTSLDQICEKKQVNGVVVLHNGQIIYEKYPEMDPTDRHFLGSVSKTFLATVIANLADEGKLSEQDTIGQYLTEFKGKALSGVSIEHLLRMSSGIDCREMDKASFTDPNHCFYKLLQYSAVYKEPKPDVNESLIELLAN